LAKSNIIGINLSSLLGSENIDLRASFMIASMKALGIDRNSPKMFVMDEMENILDHAYFANNMNLFYELAKIYNIVVMGSVDTEKYINVTQKNYGI
jgi:hypothetical protein